MSILTLLLGGCSGPPLPQAPCVPPALDLPRTSGVAGGALVVEEQGFTALPDARAPGHQFVSFGAVLADTGDRVAVRTRVRLRLHDAAGHELGGTGDWQQIPAILPGQRVPFGAWRRLPTAVTVAGATLELGGTTWLAADPELFKPMAARVSATEPGTIGGLDTTLHYAAASPYCWNLVDQGMAAVFRDATGAIVGGGLIAIGECRAGDRVGSGSVVAAPPGLIPQRTTLYPYCDLTGPSTNAWVDPG